MTFQWLQHFNLAGNFLVVRGAACSYRTLVFYRLLERTSIRIFFDPNSVIFWHMVMLGFPGIISSWLLTLRVTAPSPPMITGIMTHSYPHIFCNCPFNPIYLAVFVASDLWILRSHGHATSMIYVFFFALSLITRSGRFAPTSRSVVRTWSYNISTFLAVITSFGSCRYQFFPIGRSYAEQIVKWRYWHTALWRVKYSRLAKLSHPDNIW